MKAIPAHAPVAVPLQLTEAQQGSGALRLRVLGRAARQAYLQVFGIPDYEGYAAHMAAHHPGEPVLSRRVFFAQAIERKYGRSGPRCC
jgi:uncharacterized short protein YbdD (DUF466 family)